MLVAIGCYERYIAPGGGISKGMEIITSGKGAAMSLFRSLPRMTIVECVLYFLIVIHLGEETNVNELPFVPYNVWMPLDIHVPCSSCPTLSNNYVSIFIL